MSDITAAKARATATARLVAEVGRVGTRIELTGAPSVMARDRCGEAIVAVSQASRISAKAIHVVESVTLLGLSKAVLLGVLVGVPVDSRDDAVTELAESVAGLLLLGTRVRVAWQWQSHGN